jgi:hypothetical protein
MSWLCRDVVYMYGIIIGRARLVARVEQRRECERFSRSEHADDVRATGLRATGRVAGVDCVIIESGGGMHVVKL